MGIERLMTEFYLTFKIIRSHLVSYASDLEGNLLSNQVVRVSFICTLKVVFRCSRRNGGQSRFVSNVTWPRALITLSSTTSR